MNKEKLKQARRQVNAVLNQAVNIDVDVAWGLMENNKDGYQIMPNTDLDTPVDKFFDWHCENNEQFFDTPFEAAIDFMEKWFQFNENNKVIDLPNTAQ